MAESITRKRRRKPDDAFSVGTLQLVDQLRRDVPGQQTANRLEMSQHYRGVIYIAIRAIMDSMYSSSIQINKKHRRFHETSLRRQEKALPTPHANTEDEQHRPFDDPDHSLVKLIDRPNRTETFNELLAQIVLQYSLTGQALLWANPNALDVPGELYILPTALCYPQPATQDYPEGWWRVTQYYPSGGYGMLPSPISGGGAPVDGRDIFQFKAPNPLWRWDCYSPLTGGAIQFDILESIDQARWTAMDTGLTPDMVLLAPGVNQAQLDAHLERLKQTNIGKRNFRKVMALGGDQGDSKFDVKFPSTTAKDMDFSSGWDQMTAFALACFGVPKSVAGLATTGSYAELYAAIKQFHTNTLRPLVGRLGAWLTRHLARIWGDDLSIQIDLPTIDDQQLQEQQLGTDLAHDLLTYNEARAIRGRKPLPGGDVLVSVFVQTQQAKAQQEQQAANPQPAPAAPEQPANADDPNSLSPNGPSASPPVAAGEQPAPGGDPLAALLGNSQPGSGDEHVQNATADAALQALGVPPAAETQEKAYEAFVMKALAPGKRAIKPKTGQPATPGAKISQPVESTAMSEAVGHEPRKGPGDINTIAGDEANTPAPPRALKAVPQPAAPELTAPQQTPMQSIAQSKLKAGKAPVQAAGANAPVVAPQPAAEPLPAPAPRGRIIATPVNPTATGPVKHRTEGELFQGPTGHWFKMQNQQPVPASDPNQHSATEVAQRILAHPEMQVTTPNQGAAPSQPPSILAKLLGIPERPTQQGAAPNKGLTPSQRVQLQTKLAGMSEEQIFALGKQMQVIHPDAFPRLTSAELAARVAQKLSVSPQSISKFPQDEIWKMAGDMGIVKPGTEPPATSPDLPNKATSPAAAIHPGTIPVVQPIATKQQIVATVAAGHLPPAAHFAPAAASVPADTPAAQSVLANAQQWAASLADRHADQVVAHFGIDRDKAVKLLTHAISSVALHAATRAAHGGDPTEAITGTLPNAVPGRNLTVRVNPRTHAALKIVNDMADHIGAGHDLTPRQAGEFNSALDHLPPDDVQKTANSITSRMTVNDHRMFKKLAAVKVPPEVPSPNETATREPLRRATAAGLAAATLSDAHDATAGTPAMPAPEQAQPAMVASAPARPVPGHELEPPARQQPAPVHNPNVEETNEHGMTTAARVGVPAHEIPDKIPTLPNLTPRERRAEAKFREKYEHNPDQMAAQFTKMVMAKAAKKGGPPEFGTDDAKELSSQWTNDKLTPDERSKNRATLNLALHQTANAVAKRAFVKHLDTLRPGDQVMVTVGGVGCHGIDTPIRMFDGGVKKVQDIVVGDLLMGPDSKPREVLRLIRNRGLMYQVKPTKGEPFTANEDHVLSVETTRTVGSMKRSRLVRINITIREVLRRGKCFQKNSWLHRASVDYPESPVPLDPYFFGLWLGDGTHSLPQITATEPEIIEYIKSFTGRFPEAHVVTFAKSYGNRASDYKIALRESALAVKGTGGRNPDGKYIGGPERLHPVLTPLRKLGVYKNKHIPQSYLVNSREVRLKLLAGLLDTDGHLSNGCFEISAKSNLLANGIVTLARSLGFGATSKPRRVRNPWTGVEGMHNRIVITGDVDTIPVLVAHKKAKPRQINKSVLRTGYELNPLGDGDYYGFTLTDDGLYLLEDFTVTHNSGKGFAISGKDKQGNPMVPKAAALKAQSKVIWDSAGDQSATENEWIQKELDKRGLKGVYVYVHANPYTQWSHPERGVVKRAGDPNDGRMVDAHVFADSYALGARNHKAFAERHKDNPNAQFVYLDNTGKPKELPGIPEADLNLNRHHLARYAINKLRESNAPEHVKHGGDLGTRIWGAPEYKPTPPSAGEVERARKLLARSAVTTATSRTGNGPPPQRRRFPIPQNKRTIKKAVDAEPEGDES